MNVYAYNDWCLFLQEYAASIAYVPRGKRPSACVSQLQGRHQTTLDYLAVALAVVRVLAPPSQVARVGLLAKKGVVQGAKNLGTGGSTCSSNRASSSSFGTLLKGAPVQANAHIPQANSNKASHDSRK